MLENMGFFLCDSFMLTFVPSRSIKLGFFSLKTLSILTNFVNLNMLGFMFGGHHPFLYLLCMPIQKKTCHMFMPSGLQFAKKILCPSPPGFNYDLVNTLPVRYS
jgi:hypothetical protein